MTAPSQRRGLVPTARLLDELGLTPEYRLECEQGPCHPHDLLDQLAYTPDPYRPNLPRDLTSSAEPRTQHMDIVPPTTLDELVAHLRLDVPSGALVAAWRDHFAVGSGRSGEWAAAAIDECNEYLLSHQSACMICGQQRDTSSVTCSAHDPARRDEWDDWANDDD